MPGIDLRSTFRKDTNSGKDATEKRPLDVLKRSFKLLANLDKLDGTFYKDLDPNSDKKIYDAQKDNYDQCVEDFKDKIEA